MEGWCKVKGGAKYSGVCERSFRNFPKAGLRHVRLPSGTLLFKYEWIDEFFERFTVKDDEVDAIVNETLRDL